MHIIAQTILRKRQSLRGKTIKAWRQIYKEKWFEAYAVQQLEMNPDLIYANLRFHVVFSTVQRINLFSNQCVDQIDEIFNQAKYLFENTNVRLLCLAPDHIHLYIELSPDYALDEVVNAVMAYSEGGNSDSVT